MQLSIRPGRGFAGLLFLPALAVLAWLPTGASAQPAAEPPTAEASPPAAADVPDVVARIDGDPVTKRELLTRAQNMRLQAMQSGVEDPSRQESFLLFVLDAMIGERLFYADSLERGLGVSDSQVDEKVAAVVEAYGGSEAFEKALVSQGLDRDFIRQQVKQDMTIDKVMQGEIIPTITVDEEEMQAYYDRFNSQMQVPATYRVRHVMKKPDPASGDAGRAAARSQLEALRQQLAEGADFAALAKEHSDDERTREQGGEMPWIVLTGRENNFEPAVAELEVGEISGVVETPAGLHLIELLEKRPERVQTFEEAKEEIGNVLAAHKAREVIQGRVKELWEQAEVDILLPQPAAGEAEGEGESPGE